MVGAAARVIKGISWIYSSERNKFPSGEKMRFMTYKKVVQHSKEIVKNTDIINSQDWFTQLTSFALSFEILDLDCVAPGVEKSLRNYLMEMKVSSGKEYLFNTTDWNYYSIIAVNLVFPSEYKSEARDRIADLAFYMAFIAGERCLLKYFTLRQ